MLITNGTLTREKFYFHHGSTNDEQEVSFYRTSKNNTLDVDQLFNFVPLVGKMFLLVRIRDKDIYYERIFSVTIGYNDKYHWTLGTSVSIIPDRYTTVFQII